MNLTLSLGINGAVEKRKAMDVDVAVDHGRLLRLLQARDHMTKIERDNFRAVPEGNGLQLLHLLLSSVAAAEAGDMHASAAALQEVYRSASFHGDPVQRVAAHFADALASRLLPSPVASPPTGTERFLAFTTFYQASPYYQFAHFTANQAIMEAFEGGRRRRLHVVDFDVSYGFQWPSLIQSLSDAAITGNDDKDNDCDQPVVFLRITGFGTSTDELRETEARLARFASGCQNIRFEFEGILRGPRGLHDQIKIEKDSTVVVNLVFPTQNMRSSREAYAALAYIHSLNPSLVFLIEKEEWSSDLTVNTTSTRSLRLLPRFTAHLWYFAAVFDSLHECLPADSAERISIERDHLGTEITSAMASLDRHGDHMVETSTTSSTSTSCKERMESAGFECVKLSSRTVSQAKLLIKMKSGCGGGGGGFQVFEADDGTAMSLGWRDRALITATGWRRCR